MISFLFSSMALQILVYCSELAKPLNMQNDSHTHISQTLYISASISHKLLLSYKEDYYLAILTLLKPESDNSSSPGRGQLDDIYSCRLVLCFTKSEWQGQAGWQTNKKRNSKVFLGSVQNTAKRDSRKGFQNLMTAVGRKSSTLWWWVVLSKWFLGSQEVTNKKILCSVIDSLIVGVILWEWFNRMFHVSHENTRTYNSAMNNIMKHGSKTCH